MSGVFPGASATLTAIEYAILFESPTTKFSNEKLDSEAVSSPVLPSVPLRGFDWDDGSAVVGSFTGSSCAVGNWEDGCC